MISILPLYDYSDFPALLCLIAEIDRDISSIRDLWVVNQRHYLETLGSDHILQDYF